jgi:hypothetical protein
MAASKTLSDESTVKITVLPEATGPKKRVQKAKREKSTSTKNHYVSNAELLEAIAADKKAGRLSNKLGAMLYKIAYRFSLSASWVGYSFREDMVSLATANLCANWHKFDPEKSDNPFAFYTTAVYRSFLQYLADDEKHRDIRDALLAEAGASPSFNYQDRSSSTSGTSSDDTAFGGGSYQE